MDSTPNHSEKLQSLFFSYLKNKNLRNTAERNAICTAVCQTKNPFTTEMIRQQLEDINFHVSRASVYNTMELLLDANIVVRHQFNGTIIHYELKYIAKQYIHAICSRCGAVRKVKYEKLNNLFSNYKIPKFTFEHYSLHFYGICSKCKFKMLQLKNKIEKA